MLPAPQEDLPFLAGSYRIGKSFTVEAAHRLSGLPESHKCGRLHGHSYTVEVILTARELVEPGFVVDFGELNMLKRHLSDTFDHQLINDVVDVEPTSENIARLIFEWCAAKLPLPPGAFVEAVKVSETTSTWAEYRLAVSSGEV